MERTETKRSIFQIIKNGLTNFLTPNEEDPEVEDLASSDELSALKKAQKEADTMMETLNQPEKPIRRIRTEQLDKNSKTTERTTKTKSRENGRER